MSRSPLFDLYDPYGILQQQAEDGLLPESDGGFTGVGRQAQIADLLPPEEKQTMLRSLAEAGSSGLSTAGYLLDTPGALVRGILAGKPLSFLGSSDERVTGRDLMRQYGLVGDRDTWGNFAGGLAAEVLLDPLTYMNPFSVLGRGALTPTGKALEASGRLRNAAEAAYEGLEPTLQQAARGAAQREAGQGIRSHLRNLTPRQAIAEADDPLEAMNRWRQQAERFGVDPNNLDAPAARLMDVRIPGTNIGFSTDFLGQEFGDAVAGGLDTLGEASKRNPYTAPIVNRAYALFQGPSGDALNPDVQWDSRIAKAAADRANEAQELLRTGQLRRAMGANAEDAAEAMRAAGAAGVPTFIPEGLRRFQSTDLQRALVDYAESPQLQGPTLTGMPLGKTSGDTVADWVLENVPEFRDMRDLYVTSPRLAAEAAEQAGLRLPTWQGDSGTEFFPRQLKWWQRILDPDRPNAVGRVEKPWAGGSKILETTDNFGRTRQDYTDIPGGQRTFRMLTGNVIDPATGARTFDSAAFQQSLINADQLPARDLLDQAFDAIGVQRPFRRELDELQMSPEFLAADPDRQAELLQPVTASMQSRQDQLVNLLRGSDLQFAQNNTGIFDTPGWTNLRRYEQGQNRILANTDRITRRLQDAVQPVGAAGLQDGMVQLTDAANRLGYDANNFRQMWQQRFNGDVTNLAVPERLVEDLRSIASPSRLGEAERGVVNALDQFTNAFKVGALASPSFHTRNTYSGAVNAATFNAFNPLDWWAALQASRGNYDALARRLEQAPGFAGLTPAQRVAQYQDLTGAHRIGGGTIFDDISGLPEQEIRGTWLGAGNGPSVGQAFYDSERSWPEFANDFFGLRGVGVTQRPLKRNTNPLLVLNDAVGSASEDALRGGVFLNQLRKGVDPGAAADVVRMSQVDYSPQAFSSFERNWAKRVLPFYSFQKGILPSIFNNLLYRPGGLQGQAIRAVTRGTQPTEENFIPEHLRRSASIPLPDALGPKNSDLQRYLTRIDFPWESFFNLFTPGVGATASSRLANTLQETGSNLLGQTNPLIKAPIEYITNRQLYSGRDMSDLYSVLERDFGEFGRPLEQAAVNFLPFGSRAVGLYRQLTDDRLSPAERYLKTGFNFVSGSGVTDISAERAKQQAARKMLNDLLSTTPGVRTYENITVPEDVLRTMPAEQRQMYLLYKVIQAEAAKRARDKKKAQLSMDPLQMLGVVNQF
jgi:hypothetical protein